MGHGLNKLEVLPGIRMVIRNDMHDANAQIHRIWQVNLRQESDQIEKGELCCGDVKQRVIVCVGRHPQSVRVAGRPAGSASSKARSRQQVLYLVLTHPNGAAR